MAVFVQLGGNLVPSVRGPSEQHEFVLHRSSPEIQRLPATAIARRIPPTPGTGFQLAWSTWRRRHQARARQHHYRARLALTP
jgi:hypothetical protein